MKFREFLQLNESEIDRPAVEKAAMKKATQAFGDKTDKTKVKGMVDKAISLAKDTEDAVAIVLGFFNEEYVEESEDFEPHMMYDPKTGKGYKADKIEDHLRMKKLGYVHEKTFKEYSKY